MISKLRLSGSKIVHIWRSYNYNNYSNENDDNDNINNNDSHDNNNTNYIDRLTILMCSLEKILPWRSVLQKPEFRYKQRFKLKTENTKTIVLNK